MGTDIMAEWPYIIERWSPIGAIMSGFKRIDITSREVVDHYIWEVRIQHGWSNCPPFAIKFNDPFTLPGMMKKMNQ